MWGCRAGAQSGEPVSAICKVRSTCWPFLRAVEV